MKIRSCQITSKHVRLLLFKECDWRGRKLLFDSSTIEKVPTNKHDKTNCKQTNEFPCVVEVSEGFTYLYTGPAEDASVLGEMIFGAVAMNCKGVSLKIHMDEPKRLMCTKVFCVPTSRRLNRDRKTEAGDVREGSKPMNVPTQREEGVSLSFSIDRGDSGFYGDQTPHSSIGSTYDYFSMFDVWDGSSTQDDLFSFHTPSGRKLSTSSNGSWQRRTFRNLATRFDLGQNSSNLLSVPSSTNGNSDSQLYSNSSTSGTSDSLSSGNSAALRKNKLGLALLITVPDTAEKDFVRRCVEMSPQLQSMVCRLRLATMTAGTSGNFVATLHRASNDAAMWLSDLIEGPRVQPVWLNLVTSESASANKTAEILMSDICSVLTVGDTKNTNFFISTLLTHVLTYHLGWVTTVSPYDTLDPQKSPADSLEPRRPYNALWAQLSDLCGTIGFPPRAARTIISGASDLQFVNRLLLVLTYFVRCGDVKRTEFDFDNSVIKESETVTLKRTATPAKVTKCADVDVRTEKSSACTLVPSEVSFKRSTTLANFNQQLSTSLDFVEQSRSTGDRVTSGTLRRNPTMMIAAKSSSGSSLDSMTSEELEIDRKVVFVLGDDEKLVGLKNKSNGGKSVKKSSKVHTDDVSQERTSEDAKDICDEKKECEDKCSRSSESPSKCCAQTLQHSKPIKHSGFKFEFDKYPQIVTNYMKSKNLEILDRHYIGKPGNLKLDNFQFDPTMVPPIQEERCEACYKCQMLESMLQTPTNASELEYMNDVPRQSEPQYAKETIVNEDIREPPKTFVRRKLEDTLVVNVVPKVSVEVSREASCERERDSTGGGSCERERDGTRAGGVEQVIEFSVPRLVRRPAHARAGYDGSLLGGVSDHYVPDLILQGTIEAPSKWEGNLRRDLNLTSYLNKTADSSVQAVAIVGDTSTWEVRVVGRDCGTSGMSALVGGMLDALPAMCRAKVPAYQCLSFLESKLREFCVLSKTLADMLMSTDFCDIATLTKSLNIDVNDVPLLLAIATTHTPQVAARYGISYR